MTERETITITVFDSDASMDTEDVPPRLVDAIPWLQRLLDSVPEEHRDKVQFDTGEYADFNSPAPQLSIWYERPETDAERLERIDAMEARERAHAAEVEERERRLYAHLKAKYGD